LKLIAQPDFSKTMQKLIALSLFILAITNAAGAQKVESKPPAGSHVTAADSLARVATEQLITKYGLNADQAKQMYAVQQRKQRNLSDIAPLKAGNIDQYLSKLDNLQKGTLANVRSVLRTKEQVELYQATQKDVRNQRAAKRRELVQSNATKEEIRIALLEIYTE
jgi:hypothetical protein